MTGANKLRKKYGFDYAFIPPRYGAKDASDFVREHGKTLATKIIEQWKSRIIPRSQEFTGLD